MKYVVCRILHTAYDIRHTEDMKILVQSTEAIDHAIGILRRGGVIAHATETCYGLACDLQNPAAVERLFLVKERPFTQPVSALFSSVEEAQQFVVFSKKALEIAKKHLPGPLTIVLPLRKDAPLLIHVRPPSPSLTPIPNPTIGVRISSAPLAQTLALTFGSPIATTSANIHGEPNPYSVSDMESQFLSKKILPDLLIDSGALPVAPPSTVVEIVGEKMRVLRQGVLILE